MVKEQGKRIYREPSANGQLAIKTVRCGVSARGFSDSSEYTKAVYRAGGPSLNGIVDIGNLSGAEADILEAVYGAYDPYAGRKLSFGDICAREQKDLVARRPGIFVNKLGLNGRSRAASALPLNQLRMIASVQVSASAQGLAAPGKQQASSRRVDPSELSVSQVKSVLAAAEFAQVMRMPLDSLVTLDFERLGVVNGTSIEKALERFLRSFYAWCRERGLLAAYVAAIEMSYDGKPHAHCAVFVPGVSPASNEPNLRPEFRKWVREYTERNYGQHIARAVHLRMENKESLIRHWMRVHYLLKGYDTSAELVPAYHSDDGYPVRLGDMIAYDYSHPGDVPVKNRLRIAQLLGPAQRSKGAPADCRAARPFRLRALNVVLDMASASVEGRVAGHSATYVAAVDVGRWDVRAIYDPAFTAFVNRR